MPYRIVDALLDRSEAAESGVGNVRLEVLSEMLAARGYGQRIGDIQALLKGTSSEGSSVPDA